MTREEEKQLVDKVIKGDQAALTTLFEQYYRLVYVTIWKFLRSRERLVTKIDQKFDRDKVQRSQIDPYLSDFFIRLIDDDFKRLKQWRGESKLSTYLVQILINYLKDDEKKVRPPMEDMDTADREMKYSDDTNEKMKDLKETISTVKICIISLSERDQEIVNRHFFQEQSSDEIAEALGISIETYYVAFNRARNRLIRCLKEEYPYLFDDDNNND